MKKILLFFTLICLGFASFAQKPPLGAGLDGVADYSRSRWFVDIAKCSRVFGYADSAWVPYKGPKDANGFPTNNFALWMLSGMDPVHEPFLFGTYSLTFKGQADVSVYGGAQLQNKVYNTSTNSTTATIVAGASTSYIDVAFRNVIGVSDVHLISPGYDPNNYPLLRSEFTKILSRFDMLRMMDWLVTNNNSISNWADRSLPSMPGQMNQKGIAAGVPWEDIATVANTLKKDIWINIPVLATDDYITQLANLLKNSLDTTVHVYVEYSNEVWNSSFMQLNQNKDLAVAEVNAGGSNLAYAGETQASNQWDWAQRRIAKRLYQIGNIFKSVWGTSAINNKIRCVLAGQIFSNWMGMGLSFIEKQYGPVNQYFWGIANAPYLFTYRDGDNVTVTSSQIIDKLESSMNDWLGPRKMDPFVALAMRYGLEPMSYEMGPDTYGSQNVQAKADAMKDPRMRALVKNMLTAWWQSGCKQANWFVIGCGGDYISNYGTWPLVGWLGDTATSQKYQGCIDALNQPLPAVTAGLPVPGSFDARQTPGYPDNYTANNKYIHPPVEDYYLINAAEDGQYSFTITSRQADANTRGRLLIGSQEFGTIIFNPIDNQPSNKISCNLVKGLNLLRIKYDSAPAYAVIPGMITLNKVGAIDTIPPTVPTNFKVTGKTATSVSLSWHPSTDNLGVAGYIVYIDTTYIGKTSDTIYSASGLIPSAFYNFTVKAKDSIGNLSDASEVLRVSTNAKSLDSAISLINFKGSNITSTKDPARTWTLSSDGTSQFLPFSTENGQKLFIGAGDSQCDFYGGVKFSYEATNVSGTAFSMNDANSYFKSKFHSYADNGTKSSTIDMLVLWRKDQFLNLPAGSTVVFDNTANSNMSIRVLDIGAGSKELHFVIKNGDKYYISEFSATSKGVQTLQSFNNSSDAGLGWGLFTPKTDSFLIPSPLPAFGPVDFTDVQEVGFIYHATRPQYGQAFDFDSLVVNGMLKVKDVTAPNTPSELKGEYITTSSVTLKWKGSTDNIGVDYYIIYKDNDSIASTNDTLFLVQDLQHSTSYTFTVKAHDASGNTSQASNIENITTLSLNGIENLKDEHLVTYPNPTEDRLFIKSSVLPSGEASIIVTDIAGRVLTQFSKTLSQHEIISIGTSQLQSGMYFVKVHAGNKLFTGRFLKK